MASENVGPSILIEISPLSQRFGAGCSSAERFRPEPCHVAQQSRRDKLRVQQHQFVVSADGNPNSNNINQEELIYNCSGMLMASPSGILDFAGGGGGGNGHDSSSCDWIVNQISAGHRLIQNHLYHLPEETTNRLSLTSFQNTLQEMVPSSPTSSLGLEMAGQITPLVEHRQHQQQPLQIQPLKVEGGSNFSNAVASETQGLSLSSASKQQFDVGFSNCPNAAPKFLVDPRRTVGPLGPFTGYATILKSSKFLRPAQQLLDEFCSVVRNSARGSSGGHCGRSVSDDGNNYSVRGGNSGLSSSSFYTSVNQGGNSGEGRGRVGGSGGGNLSVVQQPEIQQKKVKLLYLQEEVCRRYKQYHQQMQMVVSSFESVAGLSAATPYASLALKAISKQFRSVKHAISNQLHHVSRVLGEDFISSPSSCFRGEIMTTVRLKYIDQGLRKRKARENTGLGFLENNQPIWRPQRGLPDRAVSVLKAWLFEHFLHPYPTDTEKHMLATQTGLTRNQVSNWFINARVRLWKPMVEEIHMLDSKGVAEMDLNSSNRNNGKSIVDDSARYPYNSDQVSEAQSIKPLDCSSSMDPVAHESSSNIGMEQWHGEKRSRMEECSTVPGSIDGGLMSFAYQGGMDIGGLGAVSLTLGFRHNEDLQQQQQQQKQRRYGGQRLHDFVGC